MPKDNVFYWPLWFSQLLNRSEQIKIKKILPKLQRAQIYLWRALNIYDDILDGEGRPDKLPIANRNLRNFFEIHYNLRLPISHYNLMRQLFNSLDRANIRELKGLATKNIIKSKLPILTDKSLVLGLGAFALLAKLGYKKTDKKISSALNLFKYLLAARQLADDSLDWQEDLKRGVITLANRPLILAAKKRGIKLELKSRPEVANLLFFKYSSPYIIHQLKAFCMSARQELNKFSGGSKKMIIKRLIEPHELACKKAEKFLSLVVEI